MTSLRSRLVPVGLIALSLIPMLAGAARVGALAGGEVTADDARFAAAPVPVLMHIVGATLFCLLGALQFDAGLRRRRPRWHRLSGRVVAPAGIVAALSGIWMAVAYPLPPTDGAALLALRLVFGTGMTASLVLGLLAIRRRDFGAHGAWMARGYALGAAAGAQALIGLPFLLAFGAPDPTSKAIQMGAGWLIPLAVAELCIRRRRRARALGVPRPAATAAGVRGARLR